MVDTFAELHPNARGRFTCWNQYQNGRGENNGGRLDYILIDRSLYNGKCIPFAGRLDCGYGDHKGGQWIEAHQNDDRSAKDAGVGGWSNAPTSGGGLPDGKNKDYAWHATVPPHSGMIYTPPQWSDHIGVSVVLCDVALPCESMIQMEKIHRTETKKCQPHASVRSITSFFG